MLHNSYPGWLEAVLLLLSLRSCVVCKFSQLIGHCEHAQALVIQELSIECKSIRMESFSLNPSIIKAARIIAAGNWHASFIA